MWVCQIKSARMNGLKRKKITTLCLTPSKMKYNLTSETPHLGKTVEWLI